MLTSARESTTRTSMSINTISCVSARPSVISARMKAICHSHTAHQAWHIVIEKAAPADRATSATSAAAHPAGRAHQHKLSMAKQVGMGSRMTIYADAVQSHGWLCSAHLGLVLVVVGVGVAAELGAVDGVPNQAHALGQLNLCGLVCQQRNAAARMGLAQGRYKAGVWLGQLMTVMALQHQDACQEKRVQSMAAALVRARLAVRKPRLACSWPLQTACSFPAS